MVTKTCRACREDLPLDMFPPEKRVKDGRGATCRTCRLAKQRAARATSAGDHERERVREWRRARREDPAWRAHERKAGRAFEARQRRRHGMTQTEKRELLDAIGWICESCGTEFTEAPQAHIDHDHACCPGVQSCGRCIRGVLCGHCNRALGLLRDERATLEALIHYLDRYEAARP